MEKNTKRNKIIFFVTIVILVISTAIFCILKIRKIPFSRYLKDYFGDIWAKHPIHWTAVVCIITIGLLLCVALFFWTDEYKKVTIPLAIAVIVLVCTAEFLWRVFTAELSYTTEPAITNNVDTGRVEEKIFYFPVPVLEQQALDSVKIKHLIDSGVAVLAEHTEFLKDSMSNVAYLKTRTLFWSQVHDFKSKLSTQANQLASANERASSGLFTKAGYVLQYRTPRVKNTGWVFTSKKGWANHDNGWTWSKK